MTTTKTDTIFEMFDAPWLQCEFDVPCKSAELQKRRFGVEDRDGETLAMHLTDKTARLITRAPEMFVLVDRIARDDSSPHQHEAALILEMIGFVKRR